MTLPAHNSTENIWMNLYVWDGKQRSKKKEERYDWSSRDRDEDGEIRDDDGFVCECVRHSVYHTSNFITPTIKFSAVFELQRGGVGTGSC